MIQEHSKFFFICGKSKMQLWKDKVELDSLKSKCKKHCVLFSGLPILLKLEVQTFQVQKLRPNLYPLWSSSF